MASHGLPRVGGVTGAAVKPPPQRLNPGRAHRASDFRRHVGDALVLVAGDLTGELPAIVLYMCLKFWFVLVKGGSDLVLDVACFAFALGT